MKVTISKVLNVMLSAVLMTLMFSGVVIHAAEWNPWIDIVPEEGDGIVDISDITKVIEQYGTSGDPTKNVNVTNWPLDENGNLKVAYYGDSQNGTYKEVAKITVLDWTAIQSSTEVGVFHLTDTVQSLLPFGFIPKTQNMNITDFWIVITAASNDATTVHFDVTINENVTFDVDFWEAISWHPLILTLHNETLDYNQLINTGINTMKIHNVHQGNDVWIYRVIVLIEYEYEL